MEKIALIDEKIRHVLPDLSKTLNDLKRDHESIILNFPKARFRSVAWQIGHSDLRVVEQIVLIPLNATLPMHLDYNPHNVQLNVSNIGL